ncbi:MAG: hypothetical protein QM708_14290 [Propioniciclava sp.]|uniref:hypothetical protein n=1 Tax=Propioniciclava sp. TaxID=2038686 RepID=UPI0039E2DDEB
MPGLPAVRIAGGGAPMRVDVSWRVTAGGRGLAVTAEGAPLAEFAFGLPAGERVTSFFDEADGLLRQADGALEACLRHFPNDDGWSSVLSLDNRDDAEQPLPPLGVAVTLAPGASGWAWTSDTDGFWVIAPASGPCLLMVMRRGFLRAGRRAPLYAAVDRRGDGLPTGVAAFHLADPAGAIRGYGRQQTTLEFSVIADLEDARGVLPGWMPDPVLTSRDEPFFVLELPDQAIVPGPGLSLSTDDTTSYLTGHPGHHEVAIHGVRGVQRLQVSVVPDLELFLADLSTALTSTRPSAMPSATGALIACALSRRSTHDPDAILDWLEREDWLARGDVFGPAIAAIVAGETHDDALLGAACEAVESMPSQRGLGIVATRCWLATLRAGYPPLDLTGVFARTDPADPVAGLEAAVLSNADASAWQPVAQRLIRMLGGSLPGGPIGLPEADAGYAASVLRFVPEPWSCREAATVAAEKTLRLLLADHAARLHPAHDGLAWLLLSEIGA